MTDEVNKDCIDQRKLVPIDNADKVEESDNDKNTVEPNQTEQRLSVYNWTVGLFARFMPFKQTSDTTDVEPHHDIDMPTEPVCEGGLFEQTFDDTDLSPKCSEVESEKAVDIQTLIEESKTDSEHSETGSEFGEQESLQPLNLDPELADDSHKRSRSKSSELLKAPSRYQTRHFSKPRRKSSIRFDSVALFLDAASEGDLDEIKRLIEEDHVQVDICNEKGVTAMHRAAGFGQTDVLDYLLSQKAKINVCDSDNWTPLHNAASSGALEAVKILLSHDANVEALTDLGESPADLTEIPEILRKFDIVKKEKYGSNVVTALYDFSKSGYLESTGDELSLVEGDVITIRNRDDPDWWLAEKEGEEGYVPRSLVQ